MSWMGQPPEAATFQRFCRPVGVVVKTTCFESGDHAGQLIDRVKNRSSIGTGQACGLEGEATDFGSVGRRSPGPLTASARSEQISRTARRRMVMGAPYREA